MRPVDYIEVVKFCREKGCEDDREKFGKLYLMIKEGLAGPIVIPMQKDLGEDVLFMVARKLGLSNDEIRERFDPSSIRNKPKKKKRRT